MKNFYFVQSYHVHLVYRVGMIQYKFSLQPSLFMYSKYVLVIVFSVFFINLMLQCW